MSRPQTEMQIQLLLEILKSFPHADPQMLIREGHTESQEKALDFILSQNQLAIEQDPELFLEHDPQQVQKILENMTPQNKHKSNEMVKKPNESSDSSGKRTIPVDPATARGVTEILQQLQTDRDLSPLTPVPVQTPKDPVTAEPSNFVTLSKPYSTACSLPKKVDENDSPAAGAQFSIQPFKGNPVTVVENDGMPLGFYRDRLDESVDYTKTEAEFKSKTNENVHDASSSTIASGRSVIYPTNSVNENVKSGFELAKEVGVASIQQRCEPAKKYNVSVNVENTGGKIKCDSYASVCTESPDNRNLTNQFNTVRGGVRGLVATGNPYKMEFKHPGLGNGTGQQPTAGTRAEITNLPLTQALFGDKSETKKNKGFSKFNDKLKQSKSDGADDSLGSALADNTLDEVDLYLMRIKKSESAASPPLQSIDELRKHGAIPKNLSPVSQESPAAVQLTPTRLCCELQRLDDSCFYVGLPEASGGVPPGQYILSPVKYYDIYKKFNAGNHQSLPFDEKMEVTTEVDAAIEAAEDLISFSDVAAPATSISCQSQDRGQQVDAVNTEGGIIPDSIAVRKALKELHQLKSSSSEKIAQKTTKVKASPPRIGEPESLHVNTSAISSPISSAHNVPSEKLPTDPMWGHVSESHWQQTSSGNVPNTSDGLSSDIHTISRELEEVKALIKKMTDQTADVSDFKRLKEWSNGCSTNVAVSPKAPKVEEMTNSLVTLSVAPHETNISAIDKTIENRIKEVFDDEMRSKFMASGLNQGLQQPSDGSASRVGRSQSLSSPMPSGDSTPNSDIHSNFFMNPASSGEGNMPIVASKENPEEPPRTVFLKNLKRVNRTSNPNVVQSPRSGNIDSSPALDQEATSRQIMSSIPSDSNSSFNIDPDFAPPRREIPSNFRDVRSSSMEHSNSGSNIDPDFAPPRREMPNNFRDVRSSSMEHSNSGSIIDPDFAPPSRQMSNTYQNVTSPVEYANSGSNIRQDYALPPNIQDFTPPSIERSNTGAISVNKQPLPKSKFKWSNKTPKHAPDDDYNDENCAQGVKLPSKDVPSMLKGSFQPGPTSHPEVAGNVLSTGQGFNSWNNLNASGGGSLQEAYSGRNIPQTNDPTPTITMSNIKWKNKIKTVPAQNTYQNYSVTIQDDREKVLAKEAWDCRQLLPSVSMIPSLSGDSIAASILPKLNFLNPAAAKEDSPQQCDTDKLMEDQLLMLKQAFPNCQRGFLLAKVEKCNGDADKLQTVIETEILPLIEVQRGPIPTFVENRVGKVDKMVKIENQYERLLKLFPSHNPESLRKNCYSWEGNELLFQKFVDKETEEERMQIVMGEQYKRLVRLLPNQEPEFLREICYSWKGDEGLFREFVDNETEKEQRRLLIEQQSERLMRLFPNKDPDFLHEVCQNCGGDEVGIQQFIDDETEQVQKNLAIQEQYESLLRLLPTHDPEALQGLCRDWQGDKSKFDDFVRREEEKERKRLLMERQHQQVLRLFPEADEYSLRQEVSQCDGNQRLVDELINRKNYELVFSVALSILVDVDPAYIEETWASCRGNVDAFNNLIMTAMERNDYRKIDVEAPESLAYSTLWYRYVRNFNIDDYFRRVPNPEEFLSATGNNNPTDRNIILKFLTARYPEVEEIEFDRYFSKKKNLSKFCEALDKIYTPVQQVDETLMTDNVSERFLQELAFITHRRQIMDYVKQNQQLREYKIRKAQEDQTIMNCQCCFDETLLYEDGVICTKEHIFCKPCVIRYCGIALGDGTASVKCMTECDGKFSYAALETALPEKLYDKFLRKQQMAELQAANVDGLESCPSCDFAYIPGPTDIVFRCMNPECLKETCRSCKESAHIPLRCNEVERPKDLAARQRIEETMTEALVRRCYKCGKQFIKVDGCNKMTCSCGAIMCYLCRQPVTNSYNHFNGQGGTHFDRCALWSNNEELHVQQVLQAGQRKRDEELEKNPGVRLVHDPTL